jgi:hypothetical protein
VQLCACAAPAATTSIVAKATTGAQFGGVRMTELIGAAAPLHQHFRLTGASRSRKKKAALRGLRRSGFCHGCQGVRFTVRLRV